MPGILHYAVLSALVFAIAVAGLFLNRKTALLY